jgi:competence/damage-inducible protein CinA-like protein
VGDNSVRIAQAVQQAMERSDFIITTGGLGPTVDDPTREALATSVGLKLEFRPELWEQITERFRRFGRPPTENNKRQAYIPAGAIAVENPVGTAPAFIIETQRHAIIALPGVPREMEYLMVESVLPYLRKRYDLHGMIKAKILHTAGAGESQIDDLIGDLEALSNPTVGLAAHSGQVDIRITAKAGSEKEADELIQPIESIVRERLGDWIYGIDGETLESVALRNIAKKGWTLVVVEAGLNGGLIRLLATNPNSFLGGETLTHIPVKEELSAFTDSFRQTRNADVSLGVSIYRNENKQDLYLVLVTPDDRREVLRSYGGPVEYAPRWAVNNCLDLLRKL